MEYAFRIRALNNSGEGVESDEAAAILPAVPAKPTGLKATPGPGQVELSWDDPDDPEITVWELNRRTAGGKFAKDWEVIPEDATPSRYTVIGLDVGVTYGFKIRAVADDRPGPESEEAIAEVTLPRLPAAPEGLTAKGGDRKVALSWKGLGDPSVFRWQYKVRTKGDYSEWIDIPGSGANTIRYTVSGLEDGVIYKFRIRALNAGGGGSESSEAAAASLPAKPASFTAWAGNRHAVLEWDGPDDPTLTGYEYTQRKAGGTFETDWTHIPVPVHRKPKMRYSAITLENGTVYAFKLRAVNDSGASSVAGIAEVTPAAVPDMPVDFTATGRAGHVALAWKDPENPAITGWRYRYKSVGDFGEWIDIPDSGAGTTGYAVTGLTAGTAYYFQIRAVAAAGAGPPSEIREATPQALKPGKPTGLTATAGYSQVTLNWDDPRNPAVARWQYDARRAGEDHEYRWIDIAGSDARTTRYVVEALENGVEYTFRVSACANEDRELPICSPPSDPVSATPKKPAESAERMVVKAVLASLAGQVAAGTEAAIRERFSAGPASSRIVLAGQELPLFASGGGEPAQAPPGGVPKGTALGMDGRDLLERSAFRLTPEPSGENDTLQWTLWYRGELRRFEGPAGPGSRYGGSLFSGWLGIDMRLGERWLFGTALARSEGEADYSAGAGAGMLKTKLDSVHPYAHRRFEGGGAAWVTLGGGRGTVENTTDNRGVETAEAELSMASAGFRKPLAALLGLKLAVSGAAGLARLRTDGDPRTAIGSLSASSDRQSLGMEVAFGEGPAPRYASLSLRRDGGDGLSGAGLEFASGFRCSLPASSGHAEVRLRRLVWYSDRDYRELGLMAAVRKPADANGRGPSWSLAAAHGTPNGENGESGPLWSNYAPKRDDDKSAHKIDLRAGWGFASRGAILTPHAAVGFAGARARRLAFGLDTGSLPGPVLKLAAERRMPRTGVPENRVTAALQFRF